MNTLYNEDLRNHNASWINNITNDQIEVNDWLVPQINKHNILFAGTGNSSLAIQTQDTANLIDGFTIIRSEYDLGVKLGIPNYRVYYVDKYSDELLGLPNQYDFIVDINLSSYAKDIECFARMMNNYLALLKPQGKIVSHTNGLSYVYEGSQSYITNINSLVVFLNTCLDSRPQLTMETNTVFTITKL